MKTLLSTLIFCGLTLMVKLQNANVEKSTYSLQTGFLGLLVNLNLLN
jgi:hypothetical protein